MPQSHLRREGARTDLTLVVANEGTAVVLDDSRQVGRGELPVGHPAWELVVPDTVVPAEELAIRLGEVSDLVTAGEGERSTSRLSGILLHVNIISFLHT